MIPVKKHISTILGMVILTASLLPALHVFNHGGYSESDTPVAHQFSKESIGCEICDFRISLADEPTLLGYEIFSPQKETVYSLSLTHTVNLYSNPLFSLRAPPVVTS